MSKFLVFFFSFLSFFFLFLGLFSQYLTDLLLFWSSGLVSCSYKRAQNISCQNCYQKMQRRNQTFLIGCWLGLQILQMGWEVAGFDLLDFNRPLYEVSFCLEGIRGPAPLWLCPWKTVDMGYFDDIIILHTHR